MELIIYKVILINFWNQIRSAIFDEMRILGRKYGTYSKPCLELFSLQAECQNNINDLNKRTKTRRELDNYNKATFLIGTNRIENWSVGTVTHDEKIIIIRLYNEKKWKKEQVKFDPDLKNFLES